jgi:signal peptidase I
MGDNRERSSDSRVAEIGPIDIKNIRGRAALRIWPLNSFGLLK